MQDHPMRERIYLPVVRFGVPHTDWKYVFLITMAGFVLPFIFGLKLYGVPAPMFTGVFALALSVAFFNFIRLGRRPLWFQHSLRALFTRATERAALPQDELNESWVKEDGGNPKERGATESRETRINSPTVFRFEHL
jgi:hypothetical protein